MSTGNLIREVEGFGQRHSGELLDKILFVDYSDVSLKNRINKGWERE